jgi:predicted house-cleaning noncanonical NTP pyrophosphatase (MazG superfamily)
MTTKKIGKLVRDKIPDMIYANGKIPNIRLIEDDEEYLSALNAKLDEEVSEYHESGSMDELADILQVICRISEVIGAGQREMEYLRDEKRMERGGFDKRVYLESIEE